jgi:YD repeat-containing protein
MASSTSYDGFGRDVQDHRSTDSQHYICTADNFYDALGRLAASTNPSLVTIAGGANDGLAYQTFYTYDSLSWVTGVQTSDSNTTRTAYTGNSSTVTDASSNASKTITDALGRTTFVYEDPSNSNLQTQYAYDAVGNLTGVLKCSASGCGAGQARSFGYDGLGRLTQANNPESESFNYSYFLNGAPKEGLQTRTDARGSVTSYAYDGDNRIKSVSYADGTPRQSYSYDANGNLTQAMAGSVSNNFGSYDAENRVLSSNVQIGGQSYSFGYSYDLAGDLLSETYPSGRTVNTSYDMAMRPLTVSGVQAGTTTGYVKQVGYWPHGAVYFWQYANNVSAVEYYDKLLRQNQSYTALTNTSQYLLYNANAFNGNGTVTSKLEAYGTAGASLTSINQYFSYDKLNRLSNIQDTYYTRGFQYDAYGNMAVSAYSGTVPVSGLMPLASQNPFNAANNRLLACTYNDARGNLTGLGAVSMSYDGESREVTTVDGGTGQTINYQYDGLGERVQKQIAGGATTVFVHDAFGQLAAEYNSAGVTPAMRDVLPVLR